MLTVAELEQRIPGEEGQWETGSLRVSVVRDASIVVTGKRLYCVRLHLFLDFFNLPWLHIFSAYDEDRHKALLKFVSDLQELDRSHFRKALERLEQWQTRPGVGRPALERLASDCPEQLVCPDLSADEPSP